MHSKTQSCTGSLVKRTLNAAAGSFLHGCSAGPGQEARPTPPRRQVPSGMAVKGANLVDVHILLWEVSMSTVVNYGISGLEPGLAGVPDVRATFH